MKRPLQYIRVLSDSRPGHENQSMGLAEALARRVSGAQIELVRWAGTASLAERLKKAAARPERENADIDLIIGTGHSTHIPLWWAARKLRAKSVVIMRPSLPTCFFDLCLIPRHDLIGRKPTKRMLPTRGALNRLPETLPKKTETGLIMIGGPSRHHRWSAEGLAGMIRAISTVGRELAWSVGDSRRTPTDFLETLAIPAGIEKVPHAQTTRDWLPRAMGAAREVWVTEDSVSMVFEAVTAGARVGILPMPALKARARPVLALRDLIEHGYARTFDQWRAAPGNWPSLPPLHETARCADAVLNRFF